MNEGIICADCGNAIADDGLSANIDQRMPCPQCGSIRRHFRMRAELGQIRIGTANIVEDDDTVEAYGVVGAACNLLVQSVVEPHRKVSEGQLIHAITPVWMEIIALLKGNPSAIFEIQPRKWEEIIAAAYEQAGFDEVILTPRSGDGGRDVIAVKSGMWTVRVIDQVKAYGPGRRVPADDVRALLGVLHSDRNASKGVVTTTSDFAPRIHLDPSISPFVPHRLQLINGEQLLTRLAKIAEGGCE